MIEFDALVKPVTSCFALASPWKQLSVYGLLMHGMGYSSYSLISFSHLSFSYSLVFSTIYFTRFRMCFGKFSYLWMLEAVIERMWLPTDPGAGPTQLEVVPHLQPCLWNVRSTHHSHTRSHFKFVNLSNVLLRPSGLYPGLNTIKASIIYKLFGLGRQVQRSAHLWLPKTSLTVSLDY